MPVHEYIADLFAALPAPPAWDMVRAASCLDAAHTLALVHGLSRVDFLDTDSQLRSPRQLGVTPSPARLFAGTEDDVFLYCGPLVLTRPRKAALVFRASVEQETWRAAPWDSGGLHARCVQHLSEAERQALLTRRTLPVPAYRDALAASIYLRFHEPIRYLSGEPPVPPGADPDAVYDGTAPSATYEVRVPARLPILEAYLAFVAAQSEVKYLPGMVRLRSWCQQNGVPFETVGERKRHRSVRDAVTGFLRGPQT